MDIFEALFTRRSIRVFTPEPVSDDDVTVMLKAAMLAPSANNCQPWHFVVIRDKKVRGAFAERHPYAKMAAESPVVIVVCGNTAEEKPHGFWVQDCSAATQNLMLAARGRNLGTVWCGLYPVEDRAALARDILHLPDGVIPLSLVAVGHTTQPFFEADRFKKNRIHYDTW
ncbi:MAG: putative NAD(P)H-dependent FMN reductase [Candidatus Desulfovibrio kirbyi]|jgi:nitroreductase|uniref:Putative NAD(P)H-dependent FMN reductase n=1 Tax=Candidatus Desulfovibrio kirbyi TaxID=2696086 RepID=A0A6L2R3W3_9BACT|nr:nitroreductase family protein [Desulfovibrio sp.]GFH62261.1 MAG: putative NAD(P)H-dependent FMN reductase [Candidatus Desulfovibrio kirbyi]